MIIDLLDKLIGRSIDLVKEIHSRHRAIFEDFAEPTYECFEKVHESYVDTFRKTRTYITDTDNPFSDNSKIDSIISEDSLFTRDQRMKLILLVNSTKPKLLKDFLRSIEQYLNVPFSLVYGDSIDSVAQGERDIMHQMMIMQAIRSSLMDKIKGRIRYDVDSVEDMKRKSLHALDECLFQLQDRYSEVVSEYGKIKNELLKNL